MLIRPGQRLHELLLFLAVCGAIFGCSYSVLSVASARDSALYKVNLYKGELLGWEACREAKPGLFRENEIAIARCVKSLVEAQDNFWADLSVRQLTGLYFLAAAGGAAGGYLATYALLRGGTIAVRRVRGWFVFSPAPKTPDRAAPALDNPASSA